MANSKPTCFPAVTITVCGPASEKIHLAAAKFGKSPAEYCRTYLHWLACMDLERAQ
jgi:hypothetical protein